MKKVIVSFILLIIFGQGFIFSGSKVAGPYKFQFNLDKAKTDTEKFRILGKALIEDVKRRVEDILIRKDWEPLGLEEEKIIFTVNYKRPSEQPGEDPFRTELCRRISQSFKNAVLEDQFLKKYFVVLYEDLDGLKQENVQSGDKWIRNNYKKKPGLFKDKNAFFEILLDINRRNNVINIAGQMVSIRTRDIFVVTNYYDLKLKNLIEIYNQVPITTNLSQLKPNYVDKIQDLGEITTYYEAPGKNRKKINSGEMVESGGIIWFEITLPEPGGYLLVYSEDKIGETFNLFPGTGNAVLNGDYRVPYNLYNPYTEIQKLAAENNKSANLSPNKIIIGGYTFDDTPGDEIFHFYYTNERNNKLERIMINSRNTLGNITEMKGILTNRVIPFNNDQLEAKIEKPVFYIKELKQFFKYK